MKRILPLIAAVSVLALSACIKTQEDRGYVSRFSNFEEVTIGMPKDEVRSRLGTPSTQSSYGDDSWYYISTKAESVVLGSPEVVDQTIWAITFDKESAVSGIQKYSMDDARDIAFAKDKTRTEGDNFSVMQQLIGNIGRFNTDEDAAAGPAMPRGARN